jgi:hypothetical protein
LTLYAIEYFSLILFFVDFDFFTLFIDCSDVFVSGMAMVGFEGLFVGFLFEEQPDSFLFGLLYF